MIIRSVLYIVMVELAFASVISLAQGTPAQAAGATAVEFVPAIDGVFDDWGEEHIVARDVDGDATGGFDITKVAVRTSGSDIYLNLETSRPLNLQFGSEDDGSLKIELGYMPGRRLIIDLRKRLAYVDVGTVDWPVDWALIKFSSLPTYAATRFEMRVNLSKFGLKAGDNVWLGFSGSDELDEPISISLKDRQRSRVTRPFRFSQQADLRVANLNTLRNGLSDPNRSRQIRQLLASSGASVYCLQEEWEESLFRAAAPNLFGGAINICWRRGCAIATALELTEIPLAIDHAVAGLVRLPSGQSVVVISTHFVCCGFAGSPEDQTRIEQAERLVGELNRIRGGEFGRAAQQAGIILAGDFNLVGSRKPLDIINRAGLKDVMLCGPQDGAAYTWRRLSAAESFWPGRLDYVCYGGAIKPQGGMVFDSQRLSVPARQDLELDVAASRASDHLMLIADFEVIEIEKPDGK